MIDGALDRLLGVSQIAPSFIVVTGAGVDHRIDRVIAKTELLLSRLRLPMAANTTVAVDNTMPANNTVFEEAKVVDEIRALELLADENIQGIVVKNAFAITGPAFERLRGKKPLAVREPLVVHACAVNSIAATWDFEPLDFVRRVHAATGLPTVDCLRGVALQ